MPKNMKGNMMGGMAGGSMNGKPGMSISPGPMPMSVKNSTGGRVTGSGPKGGKQFSNPMRGGKSRA